MAQLVKQSCDCLYLKLNSLSDKELKNIQGWLQTSGTRKCYDTRKLRFDDGYIIELENGIIKIRIYLRLENPTFYIRFNPSLMSIRVMIELREILLDMMGSTFYKLYKEGIVDRFDYHQDHSGLQLEEYFFVKTSARVSSIYLNSDGEIGSIYLGNRPPVVIYDKVEEMAAKEGRKAASVQHGLIDIQATKNQGTTITRFEHRMNPKVTLKELLGIAYESKMFKGLQIYAVKAMCEQNEISPEFIDSCHYRGMHAALKRLPEQRRSRMKMVLDSCKVELRELNDPGVFYDSVEALKVLFGSEKYFNGHMNQYEPNDPRLDYIHTGIITKQFISLLLNGRKVPSKAVRRMLVDGAWVATNGKGWKKALIGKPITKGEAMDMLTLHTVNKRPIKSEGLY